VDIIFFVASRSVTLIVKRRVVSALLINGCSLESVPIEASSSSTRSFFWPWLRPRGRQVIVGVDEGKHNVLVGFGWGQGRLPCLCPVSKKGGGMCEARQ